MSTTRSYRRMAAGVLAAVMVAGVAAVAWAQGPNDGRLGRGGGLGAGLPPLNVLAVALELTDAQQEQIRSTVQGHRPAMTELRQRMRSAHQAVTAAVRAPEMNEGAIRSAVGALSQVQADAAVLRARVRHEVFALFTPEQRAKAEQLEQSRRGWGDRGARQGGQRRGR